MLTVPGFEGVDGSFGDLGHGTLPLFPVGNCMGFRRIQTGEHSRLSLPGLKDPNTMTYNDYSMTSAPLSHHPSMIVPHLPEVPDRQLSAVGSATASLPFGRPRLRRTSAIHEMPGDAGGDPRRRGLDRIPLQMRIARRGPHLPVAEQHRDHRQALAERQRPRGKGIAAVEDARRRPLSTNAR